MSIQLIEVCLIVLTVWFNVFLLQVLSSDGSGGFTRVFRGVKSTGRAMHVDVSVEWKASR